MNLPKRIVIFIGLPGSGKGTLSSLCVKKLGWKQLSTGDLCRKHIADQTEIGKRIDFAIKSGKLVSDSIISEMVFDWLVNSFESVGTVIFDGFPRTVVQAELLLNYLKNNFKNDECKLSIFRLDVSPQIVKSRVAHRVICSNKECQAGYSNDKSSKYYPQRENICDKCSSPLTRRADDCCDAVDLRLETYLHNEEQLLNFFKTADYEVVGLNADASVDVVFDELKQVLRS